jgi:uncharacterized protein DUF1565
MHKPTSRTLVATVALLLLALFAFATSSALGARPLRPETKRAGHPQRHHHPRSSPRQTAHSSHGGSGDAPAVVRTAAATTTTTTSGALLGDEAVESSRDFLSAGQAEAFSLVARASGTVGAVHLYLDSHNHARTVVVGLYSNAGGHPGLLLSSGSGPASAASTWTTVSVTPTPLTSATTYWLAILGEGGALRYRDRAAGPCSSQTSAQTDLAALPAAWTPGSVYSDCPVSAYVTPVSVLDPPPVETLPVDPPPVDPPPVETPPVTTPPVETPPVTTPPVETPPVTTPPVETPPVTTPPVETPPVTTPPVETPPVTTPPVETPPVTTPPVETPPVTTPPVETPPVTTPPPGSLFISPTGSNSNPCTEAQPCLTMGHAYEKAAAGQTVLLLAGSYSGQTIPGASKSGTAHVVFAPAPGASAKVTSTIYVFGSHVTLEGLAVQDVVIGNYDEEPGRPNPTDVSLLDLTGRNFEIDSATDITVEGGSWGPASACGGPYGGDNNSIREPIPGVAPENILINDTVIHDVQSYNLVGCHIEGLAIFAGNHVTVSNSRFYGNSVYDVFMQANSGGSPNNITLKGNWFAVAMDNSGANGRPVGSSNGVAVGNELSANVTLEADHFNDVLNMNDAGDISHFSNVHVLDNIGIQPYSNYPCGSLSGVEWSRNVWQNDSCGATDVDLNGAALPYVNTANNSTLNYELTGKYDNWPGEAQKEEPKKEEVKKEEPKKEEPKKEETPKEELKKEETESSTGTLYLSPSGSDSAACTQGSPCKTLTHAYSVAKAGEKVLLAAGTYTDTSLPLTSGKTASDPVVFEPASGAAVNFSKEVRVEAHGVELKGFKFEKPLYFGESAEGDTARDNALHNFEIISSGTHAPKDISIIGGTAGPVADGSDNENNLIATNGPETTAVPTKITVEGVLIHEYTKVGEAHVDCLQIWGGNELLIQDNTFKRCSVFDIFLQALPNGQAGTPKNVTIQNNFLEKTIEGYFSIFLPHHNEGNPEHYENVNIRNNSATQTIAADPRATYTNVQFDGNIAPSLLFWNEATEVDQADPSGAETDYNVWYGSGAKKYGTHDQLAPAGYLDEATLNLHLTEGAAAIKHGDPNNYPTTDIEDHTRPNPPDAGATQYTP